MSIGSDSPVEDVISANPHRRHLTDTDRVTGVRLNSR
jgi:hypothetical protein